MGVGTGLPQSNSSAIHWLRKAAVQGHVVSMKRLAYCYRYGLGTEKDLERAFRWSLKAAKQGDSHAMSRVAHCYYMGQGTRISHSRCSAWQEALYDFEQWGLFPNPLEKAAESGKGPQGQRVHQGTFKESFLNTDMDSMSSSAHDSNVTENEWIDRQAIFEAWKDQTHAEQLAMFYRLESQMAGSW
mmetsp:Transcript_33458/g.52060  ORF Transcript_33458/g.52060 Transcript_33458/m.52060 type:complete len:186 (-) Transcript_33458:108-665(-)